MSSLQAAHCALLLPCQALSRDQVPGSVLHHYKAEAATAAAAAAHGSSALDAEANGCHARWRRPHHCFHATDSLPDADHRPCPGRGRGKPTIMTAVEQTTPVWPQEGTVVSVDITRNFLALQQQPRLPNASAAVQSETVVLSGTAPNATGVAVNSWRSDARWGHADSTARHTECSRSESDAVEHCGCGSAGDSGSETTGFRGRDAWQCQQPYFFC